MWRNARGSYALIRSLDCCMFIRQGHQNTPRVLLQNQSIWGLALPAVYWKISKKFPFSRLCMFFCLIIYSYFEDTGPTSSNDVLDDSAPLVLGWATLRIHTTKNHIQGSGRARADVARIYYFDNDPDEEEPWLAFVLVLSLGALWMMSCDIVWLFLSCWLEDYCRILATKGLATSWLLYSHQIFMSYSVKLALELQAVDGNDDAHDWHSYAVCNFVII